MIRDLLDVIGLIYLFICMAFVEPIIYYKPIPIIILIIIDMIYLMIESRIEENEREIRD